MAQFVGLTVLVTLTHPPSVKVRGLVTDVVEQQLTLSKVTWLGDGRHADFLVLLGSNVTEIEIIEPEKQETLNEVSNGKKNYQDPAIVRYGRTEERGPDPGQESRHSPSMSASIADTRPTPSLPTISFTIDKNAHSGASSRIREGLPTLTSETISDSVMPAATLTAPFNDLSLNGHVPEESINLANNHVPDQNANHQLEAVGLSSGQTPQNTKKRAHKIAPKAGLMSIQTQTMPSPDPYTTPISSRRSRRKPRALRQTPLPEDATMANIHLPRSHPGSEPANRDAEPAEPADSNHHSLTPGSSQHKRRHCREEADQDGWATEDATDIQDMGDFDFKKNLSKFDKRKVFDQIKQEDTTADEARLVNLNRVPAPRHGTAEGKNLHFTENVLDSAANNGIPEKMLAVHVEHSSGDSDLEACEARISSGRSSHRTFSRTSKRSTRKGSALAMGNQYGGFTTVTDPVERLSRHGTHDRIESPIIITDSSTSGYRKSSSTGKSSFEIVSSNGICPCVSPLQMLELEQLATAELGLTEEMITENAARSIAETAFGLAASEDGHPASYKPLIVILAGNTKTGSRAIAAGRHLRNHGARVVLCVLGLERESDLLQSVQRQLRIFRNCGRQAIKQDMLVRTLRKLQTPAELVVDALLGMHLSFDDLRTEDQATYLELVCWANGSDAGTLALDVPSGVDPSTGIASAHDENELVIKPDFVLSLGAPKIGLLAAMTGMKERTWSCFVADIGISGVAWKKFGTRRRGGVEFGGLWVAEIVFKDGA